jgi:hypothetical protein
MNELTKIGIASAIGGALAAVTWIASYESLGHASFILYQNAAIIPLVTTVIIVGVYTGCLLCYKYLESFAAGIVNDVKNDFSNTEEEEE